MSKTNNRHLLCTLRIAQWLFVLLTLTGILVGAGGIVFMMSELTDLFMFHGHSYTLSPEQQLAELLEMVDDVDDAIVPAVVGGVGLVVAFVSAIVSPVLFCISSRLQRKGES